MKRRYKALIIFAVLIVLYIAKNTIDICTFSVTDEKCNADVAIVLGAATYDGEVSPVYRERLNHGITLYKEGYVKTLIVTGGVGKGNEESDAAAAKRYVVSQGIPDEAVLIEDDSVITQENLANSKVIMEQNGYSSAIIVSDPLHMKRAMLLAEDASITSYSSPTPTSMYVSLRTKLPFLVREVFYYVGYKWYRIFFR